MSYTYEALSPGGHQEMLEEVFSKVREQVGSYKTASGSLVSFDDGADLPMPSFICNIDAQQDLHGYDHPWVGGAGNNKFNASALSPLSNNGITITVSDGEITFNGTATANAYFSVNNLGLISENGYSLSLNNAEINNGVHISLQDSDGTYYADTPADAVNKINKRTNTDMNAIIVYVTSGTQLTDFKMKPQLELGQTATSFAPYSNICPISGHTGVDAVISPTTEASAGTTYSVSWQTEAGEVYGGYVDLVSGVLTATHKSQTGFTRGSQDSSNKLYNIGTISDIKAYTNASAISPYFINSMFEKMSLAGAREAETPSIVQHLTTLYVGGYIGKESELDTLLETLQVKYELKTPLTYQLTPTQIKSLLGNNNAWCNTGNIKSLQYQPNNIIAELRSEILALQARVEELEQTE